ncbi:MAG: aldo/keto reductase [Eubacterium sp.]|nr:aldo/keto reductase [Eubacterium sp.]
MKMMTLGTTGITVPQNAFGALPVQRTDLASAVKILRRAYEGGMRFFDTARAYTDSEEKLGNAFAGMRDKIYIATKTMARTPEMFWEQLDTSLKLLQTDYVDLYQFHCVDTCYKPGDGSGMYECMQQAKEQGKIRHIGVTAHKLGVAEECVESGLYETLQYPFSYLSSDREIKLVERCREKNIGFIAMKALAGGMLTNARAIYAWLTQFDNVLPIWGIQKTEELEEWLAFMEENVSLDESIASFIEKERVELTGDFCRGCGYCMPCPKEIQINNCARMSLMLRRAPSASWLNDTWQANMKKIEDCVNCGQCRTKCPYELDIPELLKKNYEDYKKVLTGEVTV